MLEKEEYAIRILNKVVDKVDIDKKSKMFLCDEFVKAIREARNNG